MTDFPNGGGVVPTAYRIVRDWVTPLMIGTFIWFGAGWKSDIEGKLAGLDSRLVEVGVRVTTLDRDNDQLHLRNSEERRQISNGLSLLRETVAGLPAAFPPGWFKERVDTLEKRIERLEGRH